jgi:hypothetical protein
MLAGADAPVGLWVAAAAQNGIICAATADPSSSASQAPNRQARSPVPERPSVRHDA